MRPEVAPLLGYAQRAIRNSLAKRMAPAAEPPKPVEEQMSDEDKAALEAHYASVK